MRISEFPIISEIKEEYLKLRMEGVGRDDSVARMIESYRNELELGVDDDGMLFWIGIADAQCKVKELSQSVSDKATHVLKNIVAIFPDIAKRDISTRYTRYAEISETERKKLRAPKRFRCQWQIGDVFAYRLTGEEAQEWGYEGQQILFQKIDATEHSDGRLLPVVTLRAWNGEGLPKSAQEFVNIPLLKLAYGRMGAADTDIEYRAEIIFRNRGEVSKLDLQYIGNFPCGSMPIDEIVFHEPGFCSKIAPVIFARACIGYLNMNAYIDSRNSNQSHF